MRWPWSKANRLTISAPSLPIPEDDDIRRLEEQAHLEAARARQPRVDAVVKATDERRKRNNFGPTIAQALGAPPR